MILRNTRRSFSVGSAQIPEQFLYAAKSSEQPNELIHLRQLPSVTTIKRKTKHMKTIIIYGAGGIGRTLLPIIRKNEACSDKSDIDFLFTDGNPSLWGKEVCGVPVIDPAEIPSINYTKVIIATAQGFEAVTEKLSSMGIPQEKVDSSYVLPIYEQTYETRNRFLQCFSEIVYDRRYSGNVAEGGVFEGYFAKRINAAFPDRKLYLFDTFEGFDNRDISQERGFALQRSGDFNLNITEQLILSCMPNPDKVVIRKGYFPDTAADIDDTFVFVNLDFDLYAPTLSGLKFFYPKMVSGGVILVHDYFCSPGASKTFEFDGIRSAVDEFCKAEKTHCIPIGDSMSIAIIKE